MHQSLAEMAKHTVTQSWPVKTCVYRAKLAIVCADNPELVDLRKMFIREALLWLNRAAAQEG